jgi:anti-sigma regulatory factor (Ser/Thr protein kinase)
MILEASTISIPAESEQATIVRQFVRLAAHRYDCESVADNLLSVTDELVANAVEYGSPDPAGTVEVAIVPTQAGVRVEVHDHVRPGTDLSAAEQAEEQDPTGERHGLQIVASLANDWGVREEPTGKMVWAEISRSPLGARA